ncbi:MAG: DUF350 domain-containing protein [Verrucomicrobiota bacterium]
MKSRKTLLLLAAIPVLVSVSTLHAATDPASTGSSWHPTGFLHAVLASVVFGFVGIVLALVGFKLFDLVIPFNLEKEMCENKNVAVGIVCAAIILGICHIIAASMS